MNCLDCKYATPREASTFKWDREWFCTINGEGLGAHYELPSQGHECEYSERSCVDRDGDK